MATAIALFGFESGAALATVVGVLIEVPLMLTAVGVVNRTRAWYERRAGVPTYEECCPVVYAKRNLENATYKLST